jgi:hypothetical protein
MRKRSAQSAWAHFMPLAGALALIASNAFAQMSQPNVSPWQEKSLTPAEERARQKKLDDDYKATSNRIPDQKSNDPWATVRPTTVPAPKKKQQ